MAENEQGLVIGPDDELPSSEDEVSGFDGWLPQAKKVKSQEEGEDTRGDGKEARKKSRYHFPDATISEPLAESDSIQEKLWSLNKMKEQYGLGYKLLSKQGYTGGGLGADGSGVANPIGVRLRARNRGLQDEGEKLDHEAEDTQAQSALEILLGSQIGKKRGKTAAHRTTQKQAWKKSSRYFTETETETVKRDKSVSDYVLYGVSSERYERSCIVDNESDVRVISKPALGKFKDTATITSESSIRIIDMTGPEVKLLTSTDELKQTITVQTGNPENDEEIVGPIGECVKRLRICCAAAQEETRNIYRRKKRDEDVLLHLSGEGPTKIHEEVDSEILECRAILASLVRTIQRLPCPLPDGTETTIGHAQTMKKTAITKYSKGRNSDSDVSICDSDSDASDNNEILKNVPVAGGTVVTLIELLETFRVIYDDQRQYYDFLKLRSFSERLLCYFINVRYEIWDPSEHYNLNVATLIDWKNCLDTELDVVLECKTVIPDKIRKFLVNDWKVRVPDSATRLIQTWQPLMSKEYMRNLVLNVIFRKLTSEIDTTSLEDEGQPIHTWLFDWLPHLDVQMIDTLWGMIRIKFGSLLYRYRCGKDFLHQSGSQIRSFVLQQLQIWQAVLGPHNWVLIVEKGIEPLLRDALSHFQIAPGEQDHGPIREILEWSRTINIDAFAVCLATNFFPKWIAMLQLWIGSPMVSMSELGTWYKEWKATFSNYAEHRVIQPFFIQALNMMKIASSSLLSGGAAPLPAQPPPPLPK